MKYWAVQFRSNNRIDGYRESLCGDWKDPRQLGPMLFKTRREARQWRDERYGYIRNRPDLQAEPHGWKPARVVRIEVNYTVTGTC